MISELQGLGLNIKILDDKGQVIDLKEDDSLDEGTYGRPGYETDFSTTEEEFNAAGFEVGNMEDANAAPTTTYYEESEDEDDFSIEDTFDDEDSFGDDE